MPSSGLGNSHDALYRDCQQYYYNAVRRGLQLRGAAKAPPLLVGEACHAYAETTIKAWMAGARSWDEVQPDALVAYHTVLGDYDPDDFDLKDREALARCVLPLWGARQWKRLLDGEETPIAVELDLAISLPAETKYGPIRPELRKYTARIDYAFKRADGYVAIKDHKFSTSSSPLDEAKAYLMSDQHTGYVYLWNSWRCGQAVENHDTMVDEARYVCYDITRLQKNVISASACHTEFRNVDDAQCHDWYQRMLALRAELTQKWDAPRELWISNTVPHGPCRKYHRECQFIALCKRPSERELLEETKYEEVTHGI